MGCTPKINFATKKCGHFTFTSLPVIPPCPGKIAATSINILTENCQDVNSRQVETTDGVTCIIEGRTS